MRAAGNGFVRPPVLSQPSVTVDSGKRGYVRRECGRESGELRKVEPA
jgi:hypothetical protein